MPQSIYERHGGFSSVRKLVSDFYDRVLDAEILAPYFANVNMKVQIDHQTRFVSYLLGGPASYSDDHIQRVHRRLGITNDAFEEMVLTMREVLEDHGFSGAEVDEVEQELRARQPLVVTA